MRILHGNGVKVRHAQTSFYPTLIKFLAYFENSFDASLGLVSKEHFVARLRRHFANKDVTDGDPAWYALRNTVYASGYRLSSSSLPYSNMFGEAQGQAWRYFEKALSVHTELLYGSTGLMAVQALTSMV